MKLITFLKALSFIFEMGIFVSGIILFWGTPWAIITLIHYTFCLGWNICDHLVKDRK